MSEPIDAPILPRPEPNRPRRERRRAARRSSTRLLHCLVLVGAGAAASAALLLDVSRWGAGLVVYRPVPPGASVVVRVAEAGRSRPAADLPGRAVHCGELGAGRHVLGVEFDRPLGEAELQALLNRTQGPPGGG